MSKKRSKLFRIWNKLVSKLSGLASQNSPRTDNRATRRSAMRS